MKKRVVCIALIGALSIGCVGVTIPKTTYIYADEISDTKDNITNLEQKKKDMESAIKELEKKKNNLTEYVTELDSKLEELEKDLDELNTKIDNLNAKIKVTKEELKDAQKTEKDQYNAMLSRIKYNYENGSQSYLSLLFESDSVVDFLNNAIYAKEMAEFDQNMYDDYKKAKEAVAQKKKEQEDQLAQLKELKETQEYEKNSVEKLIKKKTKEIENYNKNIASSKADAKKYAQQIKEQESSLEQLLEKQRKEAEERERKAIEEAKRREEERKQQQSNNSDNSNESDASTDSNPDIPRSESSYIWPCPGYSRISSKFGPRTSPTAGASSYHKGIDIPASTGTTIVASKSGTVVTATYSSSCGNYVMIYHGNGVYTYYMHASSLLVSAGDVVNQGDAIARVGSTGISTGPHCHFAVTVDGTYVNPLSYVSP